MSMGKNLMELRKEFVQAMYLLDGLPAKTTECEEAWFTIYEYVDALEAKIGGTPGIYADFRDFYKDWGTRIDEEADMVEELIEDYTIANPDFPFLLREAEKRLAAARFEEEEGWA